MSPGEWIAAAIAVIIAAAVTTAAVLGWRATTVAWTPVPGRPGAGYAFEATPSTAQVMRLLAAWEAARSAILHRCRWSPQIVDTALARVNVLVARAPTFQNPAAHADPGAPVSIHGIYQGGGARVGSDLAALCHELGHRVLECATGDLDPYHRTFKAVGLLDAIEEYSAWLEAHPQ